MKPDSRITKLLALLSVLLVLSLFSGITAQTSMPNSTAQNTTPKVEFEQYTLPNGLQVILHVDRKLPVVHVNQWFHVGSKNEKAGRTGFAHLFEHMMFQGSKNATGEYISYVEKAGASLFTGGVNGTTDQDRTNYFATVPSNNLEFLLWLEADRLATLGDALTQQNLDNQRDVVKNERRQGLENQPYGRAFTLLVENIFPKGHPYSWSVIGSHEDLTAASLQDVKDFFKTYYAPNNLSLVIAGDFNPAEARRLVEKYFAGIPPGPALDRPARWAPKLDGEKIVEVRDRVPQERVYIAWPTPPFFESGDADLEIAANVLTDGLSSRLNRVLVYDRQLASNVSSFQNSSEISSLFAVVATARPGASLPQIEQIVTDEIARLASSGPTDAELNRARNKIEYDFVSGLERIGGFGGKADRLNRYNTYLGDPGKFEADLARYRNATSGSVRDAVNKWLNTRNRLLLRFHPEASGRPSQSALDRSLQPSTGTDKPFTAPQVKSAKLPNGLEVFVVERKDVPKVAVMLTAKAGAVADPSGKEGVANLAATTIKLGTRSKSALEIEDALGDLGTSLDTSAARESSQLSFQVLRRNLSPALSIFADVALNPVFPEAEVAREKKIQLDNLAQVANNPNALSARIGAMLLFGRDHPYGRPITGLPGTVAQITRDDLVRFHQTYWKPGDSALIFVGDITLAEANELARQNFSSWSGGAPPKITIPAPQPVSGGQVFVIDRQDAAQTVVAQLLTAPTRNAPDYYAFNLADAVWGGGFKTRLNLNLREDKGYSYGVFSFPSYYTQSGSWIASGGVQTNKTKESIVEFLGELKNISGQKPITEVELDDAKANRVRSYAQQFETMNQLVAQIAQLWLLGLPMSDLQRFTDETQRITMSQVNAAAQKYAVPAKARLLLVGDYSKIGPGLRELNLGEITILDAEGRSVRK